MHKQPIHIQHDGSASESLFHVSSAVILERLILQEMPSINRLMLSEQNNIFTEVHFPLDLKSVFPQTEICICVGAQQCVNMDVNLVVCGEKRVSTLRVSVYVWVCIHVCVHVRVCVLPGCVWLCQAIWSAVWGVHYPLSCAVGSGVHSICPSSLLFVPPSVFFCFCFYLLFYLSTHPTLLLLDWPTFFFFAASATFNKLYWPRNGILHTLATLQD